MVRKYKRRKGARNYCNYTEESLQRACLDVFEARLSYRQASKKYNIPLGTISNKCRGKHNGFCGHPTALSEEEEKQFVDVIVTLGEWGFPIDLSELRTIVADYLKAIGS